MEVVGAEDADLDRLRGADCGDRQREQSGERSACTIRSRMIVTGISNRQPRP